MTGPGTVQPITARAALPVRKTGRGLWPSLPPFRDISIQRKLLLVLMGISLTALLLCGLGMAGYEWRSIRSRMVRVLTIRANVISANAVSALLFNDSAAARDTLATLRGDPRLMDAVLYDRQGRRFAVYEKRPGQRIPEQPENDGHRFFSDSLVVVAPVMHGAQRIGTIRLLQDLTDLHDELIFFGQMMALLLLAAALIILLVATRLQRFITTPILALAETAQDITRTKDYSRAARVTGRDEVGHLAEAFNGMLAVISQSEAELRRSQQALQRLNSELEERVRCRTLELETANKELEAFSYSVSHDMRAPLRTVNSFAQLLCDDYGPKLDENGRLMLKSMQEGARRMNQLISDMFSLAHVSRAELRREPVNLTDVVQGIAAELQKSDPQRKVEWIIQPNLTVNADPHLIRVVMENLLGNAWKYTRKKPQARIEVGAIAENNALTCFVRDDGAGFDMRYAGKLFHAFQRLHRAEDFEGTGIGLATVARVVQRHGGHTWAEGEVNKGAIFKFTLP